MQMAEAAYFRRYLRSSDKEDAIPVNQMIFRA